MNRKIKTWLTLAKRLDEELDKKIDLFFLQNPWLETPCEIHIPVSLTEEQMEDKTTNHHAIRSIIREMDSIVRKRPNTTSPLDIVTSL